MLVQTIYMYHVVFHQLQVLLLENLKVPKTLRR